MKKPKLRTKKYNPTLKFQEISRLSSKHYLIMSIMNIGVWVYKDGKPCNITKTEAHMLNEVRYKWSIIAGVVCRDHFGKEYVKTEEFTTKDFYFSMDLNDYVGEIQRKFWYKESNVNHKLTIFWIASPYPRSFSEELVLQMLSEQNAFKKYKTLYEENSEPS